MAACRDFASDPYPLCASDVLSGRPEVQDDIVDARPGVRKGCGDLWVATDVIVGEVEPDEVRERVDREDREDMLATRVSPLP